MRYVGIILSILLIASCSTTKNNYPEPITMTKEQRISTCMATYINEYIGDCVVQMLENEVSLYEWLVVLEIEDDWNTFIKGHKNISTKYKNEELNAETSNILFSQMYDLIQEIADTKQSNMMAQDEADRLKKAQMWMAIGEALKTTPNSYPSTYPSITPAPKSTSMYRLSNEYIEGRQKVCVYKGSFGNKTEYRVQDNIYRICANSIQVAVK